LGQSFHGAFRNGFCISHRLISAPAGQHIYVDVICKAA
jgi:hypothetical protein